MLGACVCAPHRARVRTFHLPRPCLACTECPAAAGYPVDGGALCCDNSADCNSKILDLCAGLPIAVAEAILDGGNVTAIEHAVFDAIDAVLGFVMPLCTAM